MTAWDVTVSVLSRAILPSPPTYALTYAHKVNTRQAVLGKRQQVIYLCCSTGLVHVAVVLVECSVHDNCPAGHWIHSTSCTCTERQATLHHAIHIHSTAQQCTTLLYTLYRGTSQSSSLGYHTSLVALCHLASRPATACLVYHHAQAAQSFAAVGKNKHRHAGTYWGKADRNKFELNLILKPAYIISSFCPGSNSGMHARGCTCGHQRRQAFQLVFLTAGGPEEGVSAGANLRCHGPLPHSDHQECYQQPRRGPCLHPPQLQLRTRL